MAQIAERAGIPRPHAYRYVESKKQLDLDVARKASADLLDRGPSAPEPPRHAVRDRARDRRGRSSSGPSSTPTSTGSSLPRSRRTALHQARMGRSRFLDELIAAMAAYLRPTDVVPAAPDGVLAGLIGMVDAGITWWLDHKDETQDEVVDRLSRQVTLVLEDMLAQLGYDVPDDMVFDPGADERSGLTGLPGRLAPWGLRPASTAPSAGSRSSGSRWRSSTSTSTTRATTWPPC